MFFRAFRVFRGRMFFRAFRVFRGRMFFRAFRVFRGPSRGPSSPQIRFLNPGIA